MKFGLKDQDLEYMIQSIHACSEIDKAVLFGSRAKGSYKAGSDVDLAIYGQQVSFDVVSRLHTKLEDESPMPYFFDVVDFTHLENKDLKEHIERVGVVIYERR
jgi:predicted nucleotidyltransferase